MDRDVVYDAFVAGLRRDRPALLAAMAPAFFGAGGPEAILEMARVNAETDLRSDMVAFKVPTLIVHGAADPFAAVEALAARTARAIPGSQFAVYEGASHGLFFTHRDRLNADLLAFIRD
jgi:non-heme chloroperoxidase